MMKLLRLAKNKYKGRAIREYIEIIAEEKLDAERYYYELWRKS